MKIIDSCVFIAYFRMNENGHKQAKKIIETSKEILVNDYILSEIYTVLLLRESREEARKALNWITTNPRIIVKRLNNYEIKAIINLIFVGLKILINIFFILKINF